MKCFPVRLDALALVASFSVAFLLGNAAAQLARPYAGMQARAIKALSTEQVADLKAGRGMSLALAAELNGYPGPRHVLELGDQLGLTDQQRADVQRLFDAMTAEAIPLGEKLIAQEAELNALFARRVVTATSLGAATAAIGAIQVAAGVVCETVQVEQDQAYQGIIDTAQQRGCDLIVMASHGRSGLAAIVLGSVTTKVLTHTKIPVLVCH